MKKKSTLPTISIKTNSISFKELMRTKRIRIVHDANGHEMVIDDNMS